MMKKMLALLLSGVFCFSALTACGQPSEQEDDKQDQEQQEDAENSYRDFYEAEFGSLYHIGSDHWCTFWPEPTTEDKEQLRARSAEVQDLLNCVLFEEGTTNPGNTVRTLMATGDYRFDWSFYSVASMPSHTMYLAGYLQSWNNIPTLDLNNEEYWGDKNKQLAATFGGEVYAVSSGKAASDYGHMLYNKILLDSLVQVSPEEMDEQGNWTWANFEKYLEDLTVKEADRTVYGMSVYAADAAFTKAIFGITAVLSNGGEVVKYDADGTARFAFGDADAIEALDWVQKLCSSGNVVIDSVAPPDIWATEGSVMFLANTGFGTSSTGKSPHFGLDNLEDFRFVRFPVGPKAKSYDETSTYSIYPYGTTILFGKDKEESGYVWNVRETLYQEKYKEAVDDAWVRKTFFSDGPDDTSSYDYYLKGVENGHLSYFSQMGDSEGKFFNALFDIYNNKQTPTQAMASISAMIQAEFDATLNGSLQ